MVRRRRLESLGIAIWLGLGVALPLRYYVGEHDRSEERFCWRMFSSVRAERCRLKVYGTPAEGGSTIEIDPARRLGAGWVSGLKRNWVAVVERYLDDECRRSRVLEVSLERSCRTLGGRELPPDRYRRSCMPAGAGAIP